MSTIAQMQFNDGLCGVEGHAWKESDRDCLGLSLNATSLQAGAAETSGGGGSVSPTLLNVRIGDTRHARRYAVAALREPQKLTAGVESGHSPTLLWSRRLNASQVKTQSD